MTEPYYQDARVTLYHGDCLEMDSWRTTADVLVTDPPYGIGWRGSDYVGWAQIHTGQAHKSIANDADTTARDAVLARFTPKPAVVFGSALKPPPVDTKQVLVWRKPPQLGVFGVVGGFRRDWEAVYLAGEWPVNGLCASAILESRSGSQAYLNSHPHAKPTWLLEQLILHCPGGTVADPFAGSGTTLLAARNLGRQAIGVEIEERYCELIAKRLDQMCLDFGAPA